MLLYHFPLTSSSATANLTNKGIKQDYILRNNVVFETGGKLSSYALRTKANNDGLQIEIPTFTTEYTLCLRISIFSNQYLCEINNEQIVSSYVGITNSWCDFVIMKNKLYVDKVYKRDLTYSNGKLLIGGLFSNGGTCNCLIQDIRIYDYALSKAEINEYSRALVVHYPLQGNELNPSVLKDVSGFGNDATLTGTNVSDVAESPRGLKSKQFGNLTAYKINKITWADFHNKDIAISAWVKPKILQNFIGAVGAYSYRNGGLRFAQYSQSTGKIAFCVESTQADQFIMRSEIDNNWHHFVFVIKDGVSQKLYKDGELLYTLQNSSIHILNYAVGIYVGRGSVDNNADRYWIGNISDVRIYATAISAEDIKNLYNSPIAVSKQHQTMAFEFVEGNDGFSAKKNGIVQHNELIEGSADGCYNDKLITNELIEN